MAKQLFSNNASGVLTVNISTATTTIYISGGSLFPDPNNASASGDWALATITEGSNTEIIKYYNAGPTYLQFCVRGQEGTTPFAFTTAATIECRNTAGSMSQLQDDLATEVTTLNSAITTASPQVTMSTTGSIPAGAAAVVLADGTASSLLPDAAQATKATMSNSGTEDILTAFDPVSGTILMYDSGLIFTGTIAGTSITWNAGVACQNMVANSLAVANGKVLLAGDDNMGTGYVHIGTLVSGVPTMGTVNTFYGTSFESAISFDGFLVDGTYSMYDSGVAYLDGMTASWSGTNIIITAGLSSVYESSAHNVDLGGFYSFSYSLSGTSLSFSTVNGSDPRGVDIYSNYRISQNIHTSDTVSLIVANGVGVLGLASDMGGYIESNSSILGNFLGSAVISTAAVYISTTSGIYKIDASNIAAGVTSAAANNSYLAFDTFNNRLLAAINNAGTLEVQEIDQTTLASMGTVNTSITDISTPYPALGGLTGNDFVFFPYNDNLGSSTTTEYAIIEPAPAGASPRTATNFLGFAQSNTAGGNTVIDIVGGVNSLQSGLTPGLVYYVADDGTLSTTSTTSTAGLALSATEILIK